MTKEILEDANRSKKIWKYIEKLKNKRKEKGQSIYKGREKLEGDELKHEIHNFWEPIYQKHKNKIKDEYNTNEKEEYKKQYESNKYDIGYVKESIDIENGIVIPRYSKLKIDRNISEHFDAAMRVERRASNMEDPRITNDEIIKQIKTLKKGKAPGPDKIKQELYKHLLGNRKIIDALCKGFNKILDEGNIPKNWEISITKLIPKVSKP